MGTKISGQPSSQNDCHRGIKRKYVSIYQTSYEAAHFYVKSFSKFDIGRCRLRKNYSFFLSNFADNFYFSHQGNEPVDF